LQCVAVCCSVLQCVAVCCSVLQCVAVCCSVLQCVAVCCNMHPKWIHDADVDPLNHHASLVQKCPVCMEYEALAEHRIQCHCHER